MKIYEDSKDDIKEILCKILVMDIDRYFIKMLWNSNKYLIPYKNGIVKNEKLSVEII